VEEEGEEEVEEKQEEAGEGRAGRGECVPRAYDIHLSSSVQLTTRGESAPQ